MKFAYGYSHKNQRLTIFVTTEDRGTELSIEALNEMIQDFSDVRVINFEHKGIDTNDLSSFIDYIYKIYPDVRVIC